MDRTRVIQGLAGHTGWKPNSTNYSMGDFNIVLGNRDAFLNNVAYTIQPAPYIYVYAQSYGKGRSLYILQK